MTALADFFLYYLKLFLLNLDDSNTVENILYDIYLFVYHVYRVILCVLFLYKLRGT